MLSESTGGETTRRPIKTRNARWASAIARSLRNAGVTPNQISIASVVMAGGAGGCLLTMRSDTSLAVKTILLIAPALFVQLRLLCNLFDGMVAVEGGLKTPAGELFNDIPDRLADPIILVCAGYAASANIPWAQTLGWLAALGAVMTAYVRLLGASMGAGQSFIGPMAKQHRMAVITAAIGLSIIELRFATQGRILTAALALICVGCAVTVIRRTIGIARQVNAK